MPANPIIEPIDKSNSPAIINRQAPIATSPRYADTCDQFMMPSRLNIPDPPAATPKIAKTSAVPAIAANSGRFNRRRSPRPRPAGRSVGVEPGPTGCGADAAPSRASAVLTGIAQHLGDILFRDKAGTRADIARTVVWDEPIGREPALEI